MSRVLIVAVMVWIAGVARAVHAEPTAAPASKAAAKAPAATWWCFSFKGGEVGGCAETLPKCQLTLALIRKDSPPTTQFQECAARQDAVCLDVEKRYGVIESMCHPSFVICRSHADYLRETLQLGERIAAECARRGAPASSADLEEAAHWWCLSLGKGTFGSCHRSPERCEKNRAFALNNRPNPSFAVPACAAQRSATCWEIRDPGKGTRAVCFPKAAMCQGDLDREKQRGRDPLTVSACHAME